MRSYVHGLQPARYQQMKTKKIKEEPLLHISRRKLAERWECSAETIKRRERSGILPSLRLGGLVRYKLADVERIEQAAEVLL